MRRVNNSLRCKPATIQIGSFLPDRHCEDYPKIQDPRRQSSFSNSTAVSLKVQVIGVGREEAASRRCFCYCVHLERREPGSTGGSYRFFGWRFCWSLPVGFGHHNYRAYQLQLNRRGPAVAAARLLFCLFSADRCLLSGGFPANASRIARAISSLVAGDGGAPSTPSRGRFSPSGLGCSSLDQTMRAFWRAAISEEHANCVGEIILWCHSSSPAGADGDQVRTVKDDRTICFILALIRHVHRNPPRLIRGRRV